MSPAKKPKTSTQKAVKTVKRALGLHLKDLWKQVKPKSF
jgi:hypothetical protein